MEGSYGPATFADEPHVYMLTFDKDFFHKPTNCGEASARGNCPGVKHWIIGAGDTDVVEKWILTDFVNEVKGNLNLVQTIHTDGLTVLVYRFPEYPAGGINGSHAAAFVRVGDQLVFASLHGTGGLTRSRDGAGSRAPGISRGVASPSCVPPSESRTKK
jgi:hypothetical protein